MAGLTGPTWRSVHDDADVLDPDRLSPSAHDLAGHDHVVVGRTPEVDPPLRRAALAHPAGTFRTETGGRGSSSMMVRPPAQASVITLRPASRRPGDQPAVVVPPVGDVPDRDGPGSARARGRPRTAGRRRALPAVVDREPGRRVSATVDRNGTVGPLAPAPSAIRSREMSIVGIRRAGTVASVAGADARSATQSRPSALRADQIDAGDRG